MITQNIIGYELSGASEKRFHAEDPASLSALPEDFIPATFEETDRAVRKAHQAWRIFRKVSGKEKAMFLQHIATGIEELGEVLVNRIKRETAYAEARILVERSRTCAQLRMFASITESESWREMTIDPAIPDRIPVPMPELRRMLMPLGPVVVFGASNFPLAYSTAGGDVASALAAGCPVIVKAHESHPGTNALVAEVILKAAKETGMPDGVFSSLNGDGLLTGQQLVTHPLTAAVGFTGSQKGGRALFDLGQQRKNPIPVFAEMGSVNPVFILPGRIIENKTSLAHQLVASMTMTVGQFCTNPGIIVALDDQITEGLIDLLKTELESIPENVMLNESIHKSFHKGVAAIRAQKGIRMAYDTGAFEENMAAPVLANVKATVFKEHPFMHHEIFGPFSLIVLCDDISQMKEVALTLEGQLTATIHLHEKEKNEAKDLIEVLIEKAGRIIFNGVPTGVEVCAAMTHGGPYPASTDSRFTAVGHHAIRRWVRPVTFQNFPDFLLPDPLKS